MRWGLKVFYNPGDGSLNSFVLPANRSWPCTVKKAKGEVRCGSIFNYKYGWNKSPNGVCECDNECCRGFHWFYNDNTERVIYDTNWYIMHYSPWKEGFIGVVASKDDDIFGNGIAGRPTAVSKVRSGELYVTEIHWTIEEWRHKKIHEEELKEAFRKASVAKCE